MTDTPDPNATTCPECGLPTARSDMEWDGSPGEVCAREYAELSRYADEEERACFLRTIARLKSEVAAKDGGIAELERERAELLQSARTGWTSVRCLAVVYHAEASEEAADVALDKLDALAGKETR